MPDQKLVQTFSPVRTAAWRWRVAWLLMFALFLNYSTRAVVTQNAAEVQTLLNIDEAGYGELISWFGFGFAFGAPFFGVLADKISVRWLYPAIVLTWSILGASRAWITDPRQYVICQGLLGFLLAGHWPCALRTTQRLFDPASRTMGNSILQSGASIGSILTPLLIAAVFIWHASQWRSVFLIVGGVGAIWILLWLLTVTDEDLRQPVIGTPQAGEDQSPRQIQEIPFWHLFFTRRWWLLIVTVISINLVWQFVSGWMPNTLQKHKNYDHLFVQYFSSSYYICTFVGSMITGWLAGWLPSVGWSITRSRLVVFGICGVLTAFAVPAAFLPAGNTMLACYLLVACGSLGLFPIYYSLNQDLSAKHQGKVGGLLSFISWLGVFMMNRQVGKLSQLDPRWGAWIFAGLGVAPLVALVLLSLFWNNAKLPGQRSEQSPPT